MALNTLVHFVARHPWHDPVGRCSHASHAQCTARIVCPVAQCTRCTRRAMVGPSAPVAPLHSSRNHVYDPCRSRPLAFPGRSMPHRPVCAVHVAHATRRFPSQPPVVVHACHQTRTCRSCNTVNDTFAQCSPCVPQSPRRMALRPACTNRSAHDAPRSCNRFPHSPCTCHRTRTTCTHIAHATCTIARTHCKDSLSRGAYASHPTDVIGCAARPHTHCTCRTVRTVPDGPRLQTAISVPACALFIDVFPGALYRERSIRNEQMLYK